MPSGKFCHSLPEKLLNISENIVNRRFLLTFANALQRGGFSIIRWLNLPPNASKTITILRRDVQPDRTPKNTLT